MRTPESSSHLWCGMVFLLLKLMITTSEKLMVISPTEHSITEVGGQAELSCQLSPAQNAEHMEVLWFRSDHSKIVYLYSEGREMNGEASPEYANRTELLKEALGEGKVTLRIHNISAFDDGQYQCSFKDSNFSGVVNLNLSVTALGWQTQIQIQTSGDGAITVECCSGGWYPKPHMEFRNNRGERVPHFPASYSQDEVRLFHMKTTLILTDKSQGNVTCYIYNPLTGKGKQASIVLDGALFTPYHTWMAIFSSILVVILLLGLIYLFYWMVKRRGLQTCCDGLLNSVVTQVLCFALFSTVFFIYVPFRSRDPVFLFYSNWIWDMALIMLVLVAYFFLLIIGLYFTLKGHMQPRRCDQQIVHLENSDSVNGEQEIDFFNALQDIK